MMGVYLYFNFRSTALRRKVALAYLFYLMFLSIYTFQSIYQNLGILCPDICATGGKISNSSSETLYFSIVTWTTLGYGDFRPTPAARIFAGAQALLGYIYMGLLVGTVIHWLTRSSGRSGD